jgi:hypothetical protein
MRTDMPVEVQVYLISALTYGVLTVDEYMPADFVPSFEEIAAAFATTVRRSFEPELAPDEDAAALARGRALVAALMSRLADTAPDHAAANGKVANPPSDKENTR